MAIILDHLPINFSGYQEFGGANGVNVPSNITRFIIRIARMTDATPTFWTNPATTITALIYLSINGGNIWKPIGGITAKGGIAIRPDSTQAPESISNRTIDSASGRKVKASIDVVNGPLISQITVEIL